MLVNLLLFSQPKLYLHKLLSYIGGVYMRRAGPVNRAELLAGLFLDCVMCQKNLCRLGLMALNNKNIKQWRKKKILTR